jgi:hypothetical protein
MLFLQIFVKIVAGILLERQSYAKSKGRGKKASGANN